MADVEVGIDTLGEYVDLLEGRSHGDTQAADEICGVELLIAKIRPHIGEHFSNVGGRLASSKLISQYEQYCENYKHYQLMFCRGASSMPAPDKPLSYSEWFNAGRPYNHPDHKN